MEYLGQSDNDPHTIVLNTILIIVLVVVVGALLYGAFEKARERVPEIIRNPKYLLAPVVVFGVVGILAFAVGASGSASLIIGSVGGGIVLLLMMFGDL